MPDQPCTSGGILVGSTKVHSSVRSLQAGGSSGTGDDVVAGPDASSQCADEADGGHGIRKELSLQPRLSVGRGSTGYQGDADRMCRHPVHNPYLPRELEGSKYLLEEGDVSGKLWDEEALGEWEVAANEGRKWEGRA